MRKFFAILIVLLGLPIFLFVYQPAWELGGVGLMLGFVGATIAPAVVLLALIYTAVSLWKRDR